MIGRLYILEKCYIVTFYTNTHTHIYIYIYMCVSVCVCVGFGGLLFGRTFHQFTYQHYKDIWDYGDKGHVLVIQAM